MIDDIERRHGVEGLIRKRYTFGAREHIGRPGVMPSSIRNGLFKNIYTVNFVAEVIQEPGSVTGAAAYI